MLSYITLLLLCQLAGEIITRLAGLPIPGPVAGMVLLFLGLGGGGRVPAELEKTSQGLLRYLALLFVPAGVGVIAYLDLLSHALLPVAAAVLPGTLLTVAVTGLVMQRLGRAAGEKR